MNNSLINNYNVDMLRDLADAIMFAAEKHKLQKRKGAAGIPYINHPLEVMHLILNTVPVPSIEVLEASVLHDTLEDTDATVKELQERFGSGVSDLVREVSDDMSLSSVVRKQHQIDEATGLSVDARCIKIADKTCNIKDILYTRIKWPRQRKIAYVKWAIRVIDRIRGNFSGLEAQFDAAVLEADAELKYNFEIRNNSDSNS